MRDARYKYSIARSECREVLKVLEEMRVVPSYCRYSAKEFIYNQYPSDKNTLYVLVDGVVRLNVPYQLGKSLVHLVGPWEFFGGLFLLNDHPYKGWAETFTDTESGCIEAHCQNGIVRTSRLCSFRLAAERASDQADSV